MRSTQLSLVASLNIWSNTNLLLSSLDASDTNIVNDFIEANDRGVIENTTIYLQLDQTQKGIFFIKFDDDQRGRLYTAVNWAIVLNRNPLHTNWKPNLEPVRYSWSF
jgi:hypothetical protein